MIQTVKSSPIIFSEVKQKPRVVEEHDSFYGIISAVEAGIGVAIATGRPRFAKPVTRWW